MKVIIGLALAILLDTGIQILWKFAALSLPPGNLLLADFVHLLTQPLFIGVAVMLVLQLVNWTLVLASADLSYAQPITALSYISVLGLSALVLHENISPEKIAGVIIVLIGVWLISRTEHRTDGRDGTAA